MNFVLEILFHLYITFSMCLFMHELEWLPSVQHKILQNIWFIYIALAFAFTMLCFRFKHCNTFACMGNLQEKFVRYLYTFLDPDAYLW